MYILNNLYIKCHQIPIQTLSLLMLLPTHQDRFQNQNTCKVYCNFFKCAKCETLICEIHVILFKLGIYLLVSCNLQLALVSQMK